MTMKERCLRAMEYHEKGLNCGQSVLLAFADITGFSEEQSMALASGFGGGLRCGGVCGVVNAAAVVLGMVYPATLENGAAGKKRSSELTKEYQRRYTARFHKLDCRALLAEKDLDATDMARELGVKMPVGNLYSSDTFYDAAGRNARFGKMGILAVEMEAAGLYCTAAYAGKRALAICSISDNLVTGEELSAAERQTTFTNMMKIALEVAVKMENKE